MAKSIRIPLAGLALTTLALAAAAQSSNAQAAQTRNYHIESQPLPAAVNDWADQAGLQVMWSARMPGAQREAPEVAGRFSAPVALERVLQGSGLTFAFLDEKTVAIRVASVAGQSSSSTGAVGSEVRSSSPSQGEGTDEGLRQGKGRGEDSKQSVRGADSAAASKAETISEVIVTGTHIRGATAAGAPLTSYSRDDIVASGAGTTEQFLDTIPQNFGGGVSEDTGSTFIPANGRVNSNFSMGTGVNLRGLGSDSTLVLLNGHRLTQTGAGNFVDVSQLPLSAIDRVDVLTDGASAIYGSDAVAGVVNIVVADDYDGAETRVRYGSASGGFSRLGIGQTVGHSFDSGGFLVAYDFSRQNRLNRRDRNFASEPVGDLLPDRSAHNLLLNGTQRFGSTGLRLKYDATFSSRKTDFTLPESTASLFADQQRKSDATSYSAYTGLDVPLAGSWSAKIGGLYSSAHVDSDLRFLTGEFVNRQDYKNTLASADVLVGGSLLTLPGGEMRLIVGADYRNENLESDQGGGFTISGDRNITAGFAELFVPLIQPQNTVSGADRLELSLAVRHEHYSDFGDTTNPKIGLLWQPIQSLSIRSTYGRSFRAPAFDQSTNVLGAAILFDFPDPDENSTSLGIISIGTKEGLEPERSKTWTLGLKYEPSIAEGLSATVDFFNTNFSGRILTPSNSPLTILADEAIYAPIINRNPTASSIAAIVANPGGGGFLNFSIEGSPSDATVIIDNRSQNIGATRVRGLDLGVRYEMGWRNAQLQLSLDGTRFINFENQITPAAAKVDTIGTIFNLPKTRLRGGAAASAGRWAGGIFANYVPSYSNNLALQDQRISSWTTVDGSLSYALGSTHGDSHPIGLQLAVENMFDRDPPTVTNTGDLIVLPVGYDPANASPLGRFVSLQVLMQY